MSAHANAITEAKKDGTERYEVFRTTTWKIARRVTKAVVLIIILGTAVLSDTQKWLAMPDSDPGVNPEKTVMTSKTTAKQPTITLSKGGVYGPYHARRLSEWKVIKGCVLVQLSDRKDYNKCAGAPDVRIDVSRHTTVSFLVLSNTAELLIR
ncbi:hypothetical protein ACFLY0_02430 [Patescibacteria group bacterium]